MVHNDMNQNGIKLEYWRNPPLQLTASPISEVDVVPFNDIECECLCRLFDTMTDSDSLDTYDIESVLHSTKSWYLPLIEELLAYRCISDATELINAIYASMKIAATGTYEKDLRINGTERGGKLEKTSRFAYWYESDLERFLYDIKALQVFSGKSTAWRMRERRAERGQWGDWVPKNVTRISSSIDKSIYKIPFEPSWHMHIRNGEKRLPPSIWSSLLAFYTNIDAAKYGIPGKLYRADKKYPGVIALAELAIKEANIELERRELETSSETYEQDRAFAAWLRDNPQAADIATATQNALSNGGEFIGFGMQFATMTNGLSGD